MGYNNNRTKTSPWAVASILCGGIAAALTIFHLELLLLYFMYDRTMVTPLLWSFAVPMTVGLVGWFAAGQAQQQLENHKRLRGRTMAMVGQMTNATAGIICTLFLILVLSAA